MKPKVLCQAEIIFDGLPSPVEVSNPGRVIGTVALMLQFDWALQQAASDSVDGVFRRLEDCVNTLNRSSHHRIGHLLPLHRFFT